MKIDELTEVTGMTFMTTARCTICLIIQEALPNGTKQIREIFQMEGAPNSNEREEQRKRIVKLANDTIYAVTVAQLVAFVGELLDDTSKLVSEAVIVQ